MRRNSAFGARGVVALEEEELQQTGDAGTGDGDAVEVSDTVESVENTLLEVADVQEDVEVETEAVEEAEEVTQALEQIAEVLAVSAANGGMDKHSAQVAQIAVESLYSRVGYDKKPFPALESFGQTSSRAGATQLALEEVKDTLKKIWDAIVAAFQRAIKFVSDLFTKLWLTAERLEKRATALKGKVATIKGEAKSKTVDSAGLAGKLRVGTSLNVLENAGKTQAVIEGALNGEGVKMQLELGEATLKVLNDPGNVASYKLSAPKGFFKDASSAGFTGGGEGVTAFRSDEMLGGQAIIAWLPKSDVSGEAAVKVAPSIKVGVGAFDPKGKAPESSLLPTLSQADAGKVLDAVTAITKAIASFRENEKKLVELKKKAAEASKKAGKDAGAAKEEDAQKFKDLKVLTQAYIRVADQPAASLAIYAANTANAMLQYVEQSCKQYA